MKVLMISGDPKLLEVGTSAAERLALQRTQVAALDVFVWPHKHRKRDIFRAARRNRYDVITAQDPFWRGLLAWRVARRTGARLNLQVHADLAGQSFAKRSLARFLLNRADSVRVVSQRLVGQVHTFGVRAPVRVLPIYVDLEQFKKVTSAPHPQKTILWMGRFEPEKDPLAAIGILQKVRAAGIDAKLVMLGAGTLEGNLRRAAAGLPVEFPGWQDSTLQLAVADVVLSTSRYESWGASIVEALAAGVPVVAPDVGIAREAGATVVARADLARAVAEALRSGARAELKLELPNAEEWARRWRETLV